MNHQLFTDKTGTVLSNMAVLKRGEQYYCIMTPKDQQYPILVSKADKIENLTQSILDEFEWVGSFESSQHLLK